VGRDLDDQFNAKAIGVLEAACGLRDVFAFLFVHGVFEAHKSPERRVPFGALIGSVDKS
jgi:hypothetical protein